MNSVTTLKHITGKNCGKISKSHFYNNPESACMSKCMLKIMNDTTGCLSTQVESFPINIEFAEYEKKDGYRFRKYTELLKKRRR